MSFSKFFGLLLTLGVVISLPCRLEALDEIEIYLAGYGITPQPSNHGLSFNGRGASDERIHGDIGFGMKIGLFPSFFHGYLGVELESFGNNNSLRFPVEKNGMSMTKGKSSLVTYSSMVNFLLRYPGRYLRPYVGIGGGISNAILYHADIPDRKNHKFETSSAPAYQFFGGIQLVVAGNWFLFGEYKYSAANYHWTQLALNFRSESFLGGIGYLF